MLVKTKTYWNLVAKAKPYKEAKNVPQELRIRIMRFIENRREFERDCGFKARSLRSWRIQSAQVDSRKIRNSSKNLSLSEYNKGLKELIKLVKPYKKSSLVPLKLKERAISYVRNQSQFAKAVGFPEGTVRGWKNSKMLANTPKSYKKAPKDSPKTVESSITIKEAKEVISSLKASLKIAESILEKLQAMA